MPNTPVSHIHSKAPGPPNAMAVPTPTMFPVPIVEANAVVKAPNWETSPTLFLSRVTESFIPSPSLRWINPVLKVKKMWVPTSKTNSHGPQTQPLTIPTICANFSIISPYFDDFIIENFIKKCKLSNFQNLVCKKIATFYNYLGRLISTKIDALYILK
jgi:hypothetical protein